jgi:thioredoxin 1
MPIVEATDADFVALLAAHDRVVVKFYADWCGFCQLLAPGFERQAALNAGIRFLKVNAEFNPIARRRAGVHDLPFLAAFYQGQLLAATPAQQEADAAAFIRRLSWPLSS